MILAISVLHLGQPVGILLGTGQVHIVVLQFAASALCPGHHALAQVALWLAVVAVEKLAQVFLAEVARVVDDDVKHNLHASRMGGVYQVLQLAVIALISCIHSAHIHRMIAVVVKARCVLYHWCNPHCSESQCLDIVQTLNQSLEVAAPLGVVHSSVFRAVPAVGVITWVAVIEARGDGKVDSFVSEVISASTKCRAGNVLRHAEHERHDAQDIHLCSSHILFFL